MISVCMATYNGFPFLRKQVESILGQMAQGDQLVVSDNGSTDETLGYLNSLGDPRVQVLSFPFPKGPIPNFENAMKHAARTIIVLADQDDVWLPNRLALVRRAFEGRMDEPLCLVTEGRRIDAEGRVIAESNLRVLGYRPGLMKNVIKNTYMGCTLAFNRNLLPYILPIPRSVPMHDSWIGILAEHYGQIKMVLEPSYLYRVHGANLSHKKKSMLSKILHRLSLVMALIKRIFAIWLGKVNGSKPQRGGV
jgi:glycosyltransferase involved in cell wall biosynthesis